MWKTVWRAFRLVSVIKKSDIISSNSETSTSKFLSDLKPIADVAGHPGYPVSAYLNLQNKLSPEATRMCLMHLHCLAFSVAPINMGLVTDRAW